MKELVKVSFQIGTKGDRLVLEGEIPYDLAKDCFDQMISEKERARHDKVSKKEIETIQEPKKEEKLALNSEKPVVGVAMNETCVKKHSAIPEVSKDIKKLIPTSKLKEKENVLGKQPAVKNNKASISVQVQLIAYIREHNGAEKHEIANELG